jgi:hypothetical protein
LLSCSEMKKYLTIFIISLFLLLIIAFRIKEWKYIQSSCDNYTSSIKSVKIDKNPDHNIKRFAIRLLTNKKEKLYKYGYMDSIGNVIIKPQFDDAEDFTNGLAQVVTINIKLTRNYHVINESGKIIYTLPNDIDLFMPSSKNTRLLLYKKQTANKEKYGFLSVENIEHNIPDIFDDAGNFSEGLAPVKIRGKWGFIDTHGSLVIKNIFDKVYSFTDGIASIIIEGKTGYINHCGNVLISPEFDNGKSFSEGLAGVLKDGKWGYVNPQGIFEIYPSYKEVHDFTQGLAMVVDSTHNLLFIDKKGKTIIRANSSFVIMDKFSSEKLAPFTSYKDRKYGFISTSGKVVIPAVFEHAESFRGGLANVYFKKKDRILQQYIDKNGKIVWTEPFFE